MTKVNYDKRLEQALEMVNRGRRAMGMKPLKRMPKGYIQEGDMCPIQRALNVASVADTITISNDYDKAVALAKIYNKGIEFSGYHAEIGMPKVLSQFVSDFDEGKYEKLALNYDEYYGEDEDNDDYIYGYW